MDSEAALGETGNAKEVSSTLKALPKRYTMRPKQGNEIQGAVEDFEVPTKEQLAEYYSH